MSKSLITCILTLFLMGLASAQTDTVWLRDPTKAGYCQIVNAAGSPVTITCQSAHSFSVGDTIVIYDVYGNNIVNGIRKVASTPTSTTFTISTVGGTAINSSGTYVSPTSLSTYNFRNYSYGGASPVALYTLKDHPRGWLDGPSGTLTLALSDASARANPSGVQYQALATAYSQTIAGNYQTWTSSCNGDCAPYASGALKWWVDGKPNDARQTLALWLPLNAPSSTIVWPTMACDETASFCGGTLNSSGFIDYISLFLPSIVLDYELTYGTLTSGQRQTFANFMLNDIAESSGGLGMNGSASTSCTKPPTAGTVVWSSNTNYCGSVWLLKHHNGSILADPTQYPTRGGDTYDISNIGGWSKPYGYLLLGLSLCGSDGGDPVGDRGCRLATEASAFMWDHVFADAQGNWGKGISNDDYDLGRVEYMYGEYVATLQNSVISFPSLTTGLSDDLTLASIYFMLPYSNSQSVHFGEGTGYNLNFGHVGGLRSTQTNMLNSSSAAPYALYFMQTTQTGYWTAGGLGSGGNGNYLPWSYVFVNPSITPSNITGLPLQRIFHARSSSTCSSLFLNCSANNLPTEHVISKSGWGSTDTIVHVASFGTTGDGHSESYYCPGCIRIHRKQALLGGNSSAASNGWLNFNNEGDNLLEVGGTYQNFASQGGSCQLGTASPHFSKWSGTDPTGDASSRYVAATLNLAAVYCPAANIATANKSFVHFKSGSQDYLVSYFYGATSTGTTQWREFVHYRLKQDENASSYSPGVSLSRAARTVALSDSGIDMRLNSLFLSVDGNSNHIYVGDYNNSDTDLSYPSSTAGSGRIEVGSSTDGSTLASTATAEWAYVHQPSSSASTVMPTIAQPTCTGTGGICTVIEIQDTSSPKVAAFVRQASNLTVMSFTTTHSGTAQYVVSGLAAAIYEVRRGGTLISSQTVTTNDGTLYFESVSGSFLINNVGTCPTPPTVNLSAPTAGTYSSIPISVSASGSANCVGATIASVSVTANGSPICTSATASCTSSWTSGNGTFSVVATAVDSIGNSASTSPVSVVVDAQKTRAKGIKIKGVKLQ